MGRTGLGPGLEGVVGLGSHGSGHFWTLCQDCPVWSPVLTDNLYRNWKWVTEGDARIFGAVGVLVSQFGPIRPRWNVGAE